MSPCPLPCLGTVPWWQPPAAGLLLLAALMTLLWRRQQRTRNAGVVDPAWTAGLGALAVAYALLYDGLPARRVLVGGMVALWAARLGTHLAGRLRGAPEEGRYRRLRERLGSRQHAWLLGFFLAQALLAVLLSLAFLPALRDGRRLDALDLAALVLWCGALIGETIADRQLAAFQADPASEGVCERGLWGWSRHPNYFFEWLLWVAFVLPGLSAPWGALALLAPAAMLVFITKITGIPPTEAQALRSRGAAYRDYQRRVSAFVPLPPRRDDGAPGTEPEA